MWCSLREVFVIDKNNNAVCVPKAKQNSEDRRENKLKEGMRERKSKREKKKKKPAALLCLIQRS